VVAEQEGQIKLALECPPIALGGENYVFWGGREGYMSLLNTEYGPRIGPYGSILRNATGLRKSPRF